MGELLLYIVVALTVAAIVFGLTVLMGGSDPGLTPVAPDGRALPLPGDRPLGEDDIAVARFDTVVRGYRMAQVDQALRRAAYDIGYKSELISVLEAEVAALREGRTEDAELLRRAREAAVQPGGPAPEQPGADAAADGEQQPPVADDAVVADDPGTGPGEAERPAVADDAVVADDPAVAGGAAVTDDATKGGGAPAAPR
ncbi:MAG TPA: DivIVA domain-containing protein [Actinoplanes sp.]|nr:DivIVA domain-containing protein [Actinoplanes sp.]